MTLHVVLPKNESVSFQAQGKPESVMNQLALQMVKARLPTPAEYEYLSILGDWNGGVSLDHVFWALEGNLVYEPDTRNPSPIRTPAEVHYAEVSFYCVK